MEARNRITICRNGGWDCNSERNKMNQLEKYLLDHPYFQKGEDVFLRSLILGLPRNPLVLEIGTFKGRSAILMAQVREDIKIITLDNYEGIPEDNVYSSVDEVNNNIRFSRCVMQILHLQLNSFDYKVNTMFDLLFIDGDHTFEGVKHDFEKFLPFVKKEGIILFHDFHQEEGVTRFCNTLSYNLCQRHKSMLAIRKCDLC